MSEYQHPSEVVNLPSEGKFYPEGSPLRDGTLEIKYPTAKEEDILTSTNLVRKRVVLDEFLKSIILSKDEQGRAVSPLELLIGDYNAVLVAARVLAYGKDYEIHWRCPDCSYSNTSQADLSALETKSVTIKPTADGLIDYELQGVPLKLKLLTREDDRNVDRHLENLAKNNLPNTVITERLISIIHSVNGDEKKVREFATNMLIKDARKLREDYAQMVPELDYSLELVCSNCGEMGRRDLVIGHDFFWPDIQI